MGAVFKITPSIGHETTHDTGCPRAWFNESIPGRRIGYDEEDDTRVGFGERRVDGKARDDKYVEAVRYFCLRRVRLGASWSQ